MVYLFFCNRFMPTIRTACMRSPALTAAHWAHHLPILRMTDPHLAGLPWFVRSSWVCWTFTAWTVPTPLLVELVLHFPHTGFSRFFLCAGRWRPTYLTDADHRPCRTTSTPVLHRLPGARPNTPLRTRVPLHGGRFTHCSPAMVTGHYRFRTLRFLLLFPYTVFTVRHPPKHAFHRPPTTLPPLTQRLVCGRFWDRCKCMV